VSIRELATIQVRYLDRLVVCDARQVVLKYVELDPHA
jgi:hypothetical protein